MGNDWSESRRGFVRTIVHWTGVDAAIWLRIVPAPAVTVSWERAGLCVRCIRYLDAIVFVLRIYGNKIVRCWFVLEIVCRVHSGMTLDYDF